MKPRKFKIGQPVTLIGKPTKFTLTKGTGNCERPIFGKIYHVEDHESGVGTNTGEWCIFLNEIIDNVSFNESAFAPVITDTELYKELESINKTQTVEV